MSILLGVVYFYAAGWAGSTVYWASDCWNDKDMTRQECLIGSAQVSTMWPVAIPAKFVGDRMH